MQFDQELLDTAKRMNVDGVIKHIQKVYRGRSYDPDEIAKDILLIYLSDAWRHRDFSHKGLSNRTFTNFRQFVEDGSPHGLGIKWHKIKRICHATVAETMIKQVEAEVELNPHGGNGSNQYKKKDSKVDNVNLAKGGNDPSYKLRRVKQTHPELAQKVIEGQLSANAAYIQAGFAVKKVSVPLQEDKVISFLHRYFNEEQRKYIADHL